MQKNVTSFDGTIINYDIDKLSEFCIVFLHGAGGNLTAWKKERVFFHKKGISTLAIDLRGHGGSGRPANSSKYTLDKFAKDIPVVLKAEQVTNFILVGHCFGGVITIMFHKLFPRLAKSYILIDTTYTAPTMFRVLGSNKTVLRIFNKFLGHMPNTKTSFVDFSKIVGTNDINLKRMYYDIVSTSLKSWIYTYSSLSKFDGVKVLKSIKKPLLIIHGANDTIFDVSKAKKIRDIVSKSELKIIPNANHIIVMNNPDALNATIYKFIKKLYHV